MKLLLSITLFSIALVIGSPATLATTSLAQAEPRTEVTPEEFEDVLIERQEKDDLVQEEDALKRLGIVTRPLGNLSVPQLAGRIINGLLGIVGVIAFLVFIYGGATYMLSRGSDEKVKQAVDSLKWGAIGLAIIFGSYAIVNFVIGALQ